MRQFLFRLKSFIRDFSFWGVIWLLTLIFGLKVPINDIVKYAFDRSNALSYLFLYLLVSAPLFLFFLICDFLSEIREGEMVKDILFHSTLARLSLMWKYPLNIINVRKLYGNRETVKMMMFSFISYLFSSILWWFIFIYGIVLIVTTPNNPVLLTVQSIPQKELLYRLAIILIAYIVILILVILIEKKIAAKEHLWLKTNSNKPGGHGQNYYDRYPEQKPAACRACGGPYPDCMWSCDLIDE